MHSNYEISKTSYLEPLEAYFDKNIYPDFQEKYLDFKDNLIYECQNNKSKTYYKFGDGDYYLFANETVGTTKPGKRDLKKTFIPINKKKMLENVNNADYCLCEIINFHLFNKVINREVTYPAEYIYGSVANKWFFKEFKKIAIIGNEVKLEILHELMQRNEYKDYLGIDQFTDLIPIQQTGAVNDAKKIYRKISKQVSESDAEIFLLGIGHSQNFLLNDLKKISRAPLVCIGSGVDAIAGVIDIYRPYFGDWKNYRIKNLSLYEKIIDPVLNITSTGPNVKEIE